MYKRRTFGLCKIHTKSSHNNALLRDFGQPGKVRKGALVVLNKVKTFNYANSIKNGIKNLNLFSVKKCCKAPIFMV